MLQSIYQEKNLCFPLNPTKLSFSEAYGNDFVK